MPVKLVLHDEVSKVPVYSWIAEIESNAQTQLMNLSKLPFIHKHVAVMPDVHSGIGSTIGSVIPTINAVIPAAVGVDIACGMTAVQTTLKAEDLPDNLLNLRLEIEQKVPHGRTNNGGRGDKGSWAEIPTRIGKYWHSHLATEYSILTEANPGIEAYNTIEHLGTLGTGNHFIEVCLDQEDTVWLLLHTGSRGPGNRIGQVFIEQARIEMDKYFISGYLQDINLAYLVRDTPAFNAYIIAMQWAQKFAKINRSLIMDAVIDAVKSVLKVNFSYNAIHDVHHNFVAVENHYGKNVFVTRKGAVRARLNDICIIPGSMGAKTYICKGLGNEASFTSCSHGAGRCVSRNAAMKLYTVNDLIAQTEGIECPKDESRLDEIPCAYKDIDLVMECQSDLVEPIYQLHQIVNVKG